MSNEDTLSGFNTTPDDILEVAVYGTQAACVKYGELTITIKDEPENNLEINLLEQKNDNVVMRDNILNTPLIYTTRLDHMKAFDKIERHTSKEITEMIIKESKPGYRQTPELIKVEPIDADINTYIKLNCQVHHMNTKVKIETSLRNDKLLKLCKPLKIVLNDIKTYIKPMKMPTDDDVSDYLTDSSSDDEPLSKCATDSRENRTPKAFHDIVAIAMKDKRSQEVDLYIVNSKGVKSYYRTSREQCDKLQTLHQSSKLIFLEYCCWVDRERHANVTRRKLARLLGSCRTSITNYMRTPHNCLPRPCTCCCGSRKRNNEELNRLFKNKTVNKEYITATNNIFKNNIIEKALNYVPEVDVIEAPITTDSDYLKNAVIIIKYHEVIFAQYQFNYILGENYEIGSDGDVISYVRPTVNRSITEEKQLYQKHDKPNKPRTYFSSLVCCWHRREDMIKNLRESFSVLPSTLRFLRNPHSCKVAKCVCCCKPVPMINLKLQNQPILSTNKKQDNTSANEESKQNHTLHDENRKLIYLNDKGKDTNIRRKRRSQVQPKHFQQRKRFNIPIQTDKVIKISKSLLGNVPQPTVQNTIDLTIGSCYQQDPIPNHPVAISKRITSTTKDQPSDNPPVAISKRITSTTTDQPSVNPPAAISKRITSTIKDQPSVNPPVAISKQITSTINGQPSVNFDTNINTNPAEPTNTYYTSLMQSFLDKIKDFKLSVNEYGKLTAVINSSPEQMPTENIKIISDVLLLASEQIKALGITAQEFCNRVNNYKSVDGLSSLLKPQLTPIHTLPMGGANSSTSTKTRSTPDFKVPKTRDLNAVCSIFQMMSSLGGQKNRHLVEAYRIHFGENEDNSAPITLLNSNQYWEPPKITGEVSITNDKSHTVMPTLSPVRKRKINKTIQTQTQTNEPTEKKRLIPVNQLPPLQLQIEIPEIGTDKNRTPQSNKTFETIMQSSISSPQSSRNFKTLQNTSSETTPSQTPVHNITIPQLTTIDGQVPFHTQSLIDNVVPALINNNNLPKINIAAPQHQIEANFSIDPTRTLSGAIPQTDVKTEALIVIDDSSSDVSAPDLEDDVQRHASDYAMTQNNASVSSANVPATPVLAGNPLLYNILSKSPPTPCPNTNTPAADTTRGRFGQQVSVTPIILQHIKGRKKQNNKMPSVKVDKQISINDEEDFETTLKTNVISTKTIEKISHDEILETVNNKQLITDNDEVEGIFGV